VKRPIVLALNPSMDAEWHVDGVRWEEKNNITFEYRWPGGKGVNVARWLTHLGTKPLILLPLGGATGRELAQGLAAEGIAARVISIAEETRVNVIVTTRQQGQLRFNPPGPKISRREGQRILSALRAELPRARCLILSGSLPRGLPPATYAALIKLANRRNVPVFLDCDGEALTHAAKARPFLVKPNEAELVSWARSVGLKPGRSEKEIRRLALQLARVTQRWVLVSRGSKAAWLVHGKHHHALRAKPPRVKPLTTVGAGDALLAAVIASVFRADDFPEWLQKGLATGAVATQLPSGTLPK